MSLPRKGSRGITVAGRRYRWIAAYSKVLWCSAACPLRLAVQRQGGRGQILIANFRGIQKDDSGQEWVFPRYGAEVTPGVVADIIRAALAAGWEAEVPRPAPFQLNGEPFLHLPEDPTQPPPGSGDDLKRRFLSALRDKIIEVAKSPPPSNG